MGLHMTTDEEARTKWCLLGRSNGALNCCVLRAQPPLPKRRRKRRDGCHEGTSLTHRPRRCCGRLPLPSHTDAATLHQGTPHVHRRGSGIPYRCRGASPPTPRACRWQSTAGTGTGSRQQSPATCNRPCWSRPPAKGHGSGDRKYWRTGVLTHADAFAIGATPWDGARGEQR